MKLDKVARALPGAYILLWISNPLHRHFSLLRHIL